MYIYDNLNELDDNKGYAVSPTAYVILDCGR